jgi:hypothetical protein
MELQSMENFVLSVIISIFSTLLPAQDISVGIKYGNSWSGSPGWYDFLYYENTEINERVGKNLGVALRMGMKDFLSIQLEVHTEQSGFEKTDHHTPKMSLPSLRSESQFECSGSLFG